MEKSNKVKGKSKSSAALLSVPREIHCRDRGVHGGKSKNTPAFFAMQSPSNARHAITKKGKNNSVERGKVRAGLYDPNLSERGFQKSPSRPRSANILTISSGLGRREFSCKRVEYHVVASVHSWAMLTSGRTGVSCAAHHSRTSSSDRKKSMLLQVKTMSSHHFAAGTRQWKSQSDGSGPCRPTLRRYGSPDCSQREWTVHGW